METLGHMHVTGKLDINKRLMTQVAKRLSLPLPLPLSLSHTHTHTHTHTHAHTQSVPPSQQETVGLAFSLISPCSLRALEIGSAQRVMAFQSISDTNNHTHTHTHTHTHRAS